jgi:hypothetical protein
MEWRAGFHSSGHKPILATDLFLFHLRAMDYNLASERVAQLNRLKFSKNNQQKKLSYHFKLTPKNYLKAFFFAAKGEFDAAQESFDFSDDLLAFQESNYDVGFVGKIRRIPERFSDSVKLVPPQVYEASRPHIVQRFRAFIVNSVNW